MFHTLVGAWDVFGRVLENEVGKKLKTCIVISKQGKTSAENEVGKKLRTYSVI